MDIFMMILIEGITKISLNNIRLIIDSTKQSIDDNNQTFFDYGLSSIPSKAYLPILLYLCYRKNTGETENDWESINVTELSNPSPLPDVFKTDDDKKDAVQVAS